MSRFDFACNILNKIKHEHDIIVKKINAIKRHEYKTIANRPQNSVLDSQKFYKTFKINEK